MVESCHLLMFWGMYCFISGKSFLFKNTVVLRGGGGGGGGGGGSPLKFWKTRFRDNG